PGGGGVDDWRAARNDVCDHMPGAWADSEAVAAEPCGQDETWNRLNFADCGDAVWRAVDVAGPDTRDFDVLKFRQQLASSSMRRPNLLHVGARIERAVQLHRGNLIQLPFSQGFMALPHP